MHGIDVSKNQPVIDWAKVKRSGYEWAIIRAGYQGYSNGGFKVDPCFTRHMDGAAKVGLPVGVYWIDQAINTEEATAAADYVCNLIKPYKVPLGVWWDNEPTEAFPNGRADQLNKQLRTQIGVAFLSGVEKHGYLGGVYTNLDYLTYKLDYAQLGKYPLWLAQWGAAKPSRTCDIWQKDAGTVDGVLAKCDRNIMYSPDLIKRISGGSKKPLSSVPYDAYVVADCLDIRSGGGAGYALRGVLHKYEKIKILKVVAGWGKVAIRDGYYGWVHLSGTKKK